MAATINHIKNILGKDFSFLGIVDASLTTPVPELLLSSLKDIENVAEQLSRVTNLIVKVSQLNQLLVRLTEILVAVESEFRQSGNRLSPEQNLFLNELIKTTTDIQTYLFLLNRKDVVNNVYTKLSNMQLISSSQIQDIESLLNVGSASNSIDFISQITRQTNTTFNDIKNLDPIVASIRNVILLRPLSQNSSYTFVMLTGPPGTGKTSLARAIATFHSGGTYLNLDISALLGQYVGQTEKRISQLFQYVGENRDRKFTIVMDELDIVLGSGAENAAYLTTLRNSLQVALDPDVLGPNLVIVGMTNFFNRLNDVIKRRATNTFYIPLPALEDSLNYLFGQIEATYYTFILGSSTESAISGVYRADVGRLFAQYEGFRFSNANMRNIAQSASSHALTNADNEFYNLRIGDSTLKVCIPDVAYLSDFAKERLQMSISSDILSVSQELENNRNFYRFLFVMPSISDLAIGISQTTILNTQSEQEFIQQNAVQ